MHPKRPRKRSNSLLVAYAMKRILAPMKKLTPQDYRALAVQMAVKESGT